MTAGRKTKSTGDDYGGSLCVGLGVGMPGWGKVRGEERGEVRGEFE